MKRNILILITGLLSVFIINEAKAEKKVFAPDLRIGPSFGVNFSQVAFSPNISQNFLLKYNGGITARYTSERYFGLQGELNFSMRGWERKFRDSPRRYSRTLNYIEMPIMSHIYFGSDVVRGFVNLGPKIGFLINEKEEANFTVPDNEKEKFEEINKKAEKKFDWGICGGGGLEIRTDVGSFLLEGRYYFGLGNIFNSRKADPFGRSAFSTISVNFVYLIPIRISSKSVK